MKNHETESSIISELCDNIENETKAIINTNEHNEQLHNKGVWLQQRSLVKS